MVRVNQASSFHADSKYILTKSLNTKSRVARQQLTTALVDQLQALGEHYLRTSR